MNGLRGELNLFRRISETDIQFDIHRTSGEVLLQVYHNSDINRWNFGVDFGNTEGYVVEIRFSINGKNKDFKRFELSEYHALFSQFEGVEPKGAYFKFIEASITDDDMTLFLTKLIHAVYLIENNRMICHISGSK